MQEKLLRKRGAEVSDISWWKRCSNLSQLWSQNDVDEEDEITVDDRPSSQNGKSACSEYFLKELAVCSELS